MAIMLLVLKDAKMLAHKKKLRQGKDEGSASEFEEEVPK